MGDDEPFVPMMKPLGDGPILPPGRIVVMPQPPMTLRDWFAGMALQGVLSHGPVSSMAWEYNARIAYEQADVMLTERERA